jgi:LmbE family N-acetylglucosaminyl deacetylase
MTSLDLPAPGIALAIGAHPDDVEFGCGATLAKWAATGSETHILVLTDGSKGSWDPREDPAAVADRRIHEQAQAAAKLGAKKIHVGGLIDGELYNGRGEREAVVAVIRRIKPDVVLTHDPWKRYRLHPDHRAAGYLVLDSIVAARDPHYFSNLKEAPHRPDQILLFEAEEVDHLELVDDFVDAKVNALLAHRSQWLSTMGIDEAGPHADDQRFAFATRIRSEAETAGGGRPAEAFKHITDI